MEKLSREDIEKKVNAILVDKLFIEDEDCRPEARLVHELGADSLDIVDIGMSLERSFGISISDEQMEALSGLTVGELYDFIGEVL